MGIFISVAGGPVSHHCSTGSTCTIVLDILVSIGIMIRVPALTLFSQVLCQFCYYRYDDKIKGMNNSGVPVCNRPV